MKFPETESPRMLAQRGRKLSAALKVVLERQTWTRQALEDHQWKWLQAQARHAYEHFDFYRAKYDAAKFHPSDLRGPEDLVKIPFLTRDELRQADLWTNIEPAHAIRRLSSSGSTGIPIRVIRDESALWHFTAANMALYHDWCRGQPLANVLYFLDDSPDSMDCAAADFLRTTVAEERLVPITEGAEAALDRIAEFEPEFISSYPSTMRNIAMTLHRRGERYSKLRLLHLTSEMTDPQARRLLNLVFPEAQIVETYTSTEAGLVAWPCEAEGRLHLTEDSAIYEIVDADGKPTDGTGELVVTDLINQSMPLVRYRGLGDYCRWAESGCRCGSILRSIRHLEGRYAESLMRPDGTLLSPYVLADAMDDVPGMYQYQLVQRTPVEFEVLVVRSVDAMATEADMQAAIGRIFTRVFDGGVQPRVRFVDQIRPKPGAHKIPLVISCTGRPA